MALTATIHNFDIELADADRHVYESLALRVARHPSESEEYLVTRVLAYVLELTEGIEFSRGVSDPEEPTLAVRDLTGAITTWIEIGTPDAARLHIAALTARLERRVAFSLSVTDRELYLSIGTDTLTGTVTRLQLC
jgi:uncharacterized protein YaeQ